MVKDHVTRITGAGLAAECAAFFVRNLQDVPQEQQQALIPSSHCSCKNSIEALPTLQLKHFRHAYRLAAKTSAAAASWKAIV